MPQTPPERAARWPGQDGEAIAFLEATGYHLNRNWSWTAPRGRKPTERELDAIQYLIEEWDFDGIRTPSS